MCRRVAGKLSECPKCFIPACYVSISWILLLDFFRCMDEGHHNRCFSSKLRYGDVKLRRHIFKISSIILLK